MSKLTPEDKKDIINNFGANKKDSETELNEEAPEEITNEEIDSDIVDMEVPDLEESKIINSFIKEINRYDKGLATKLSPFAKRRALRKKLSEINTELKKVKNKNINSFTSLEETD